MQEIEYLETNGIVFFCETTDIDDEYVTQVPLSMQTNGVILAEWDEHLSVRALFLTILFTTLN